jgi:hypothetical protein
MGHPFRLLVDTLIPMPDNLKRFHTFGHDHFVTFSWRVATHWIEPTAIA